MAAGERSASLSARGGLLSSIRKQQDLLARVRSGELKLPDGGAKVEAKLLEMEAALERLNNAKGALRDKAEGDGEEQPDSAMGAAVESEGRSPQDAPVSLHRAGKATPTFPSSLPPDARRILELRRLAEKETVQDEDISPLRPKPGGLYRERNGMLEPAVGRISREAAARARRKAEKEIAEEVDAQADQLASLRLDGDAPASQEMTATAGLGDGRAASKGDEEGWKDEAIETGPRVVPGHRSVKLISVEEAAEWEKQHERAVKAHEEKIFARHLAAQAGSRGDTREFSVWEGRKVAEVGESSDEDEESTSDGEGDELEPDDDANER